MALSSPRSCAVTSNSHGCAPLARSRASHVVTPLSRLVMPACLLCALLVPSRYFLALSLYLSLCIYLAPG
ncbi:hypothetical protein DENSPDRAFT_846356 [Dentipellis sp. KUC8613]|nr:hypothetical protein DENSPDRAFT_846356 [Dentipellis sp. KUC8613]